MANIVSGERLHTWELLNTSDPLLPAVRGLYESALESDERVPWEWLERGVKSRSEWRPGGSNRHLIVASPERGTDRPEKLAGFAFVSHLPGYGGYLSYLAVADEFRKRGVGRRLYEQAFNVLAVDAAATEEPLPFVIWESRRPDESGSPEAWAIWHARMRLFAKSGGYWIDGVTLPSPNWLDDTRPPVPLHLFLAPLAADRESFDARRLREVVHGLLTHVYRVDPGDAEYDGTLTPGCHPRLKPATDAGRAVAAVR